MDVYQRRRLVALSVIAGIFILFVLLIRSCGGDDEEPAPLAAGASGPSGVAGVTSLPQPDYIAQGDPICLEANTSLANVDESDPVQADNDKAQIVGGELQQLQTLPPPEDGADDLDKFLSTLEKQSLAYQDRATASERGDDASVAELNETIDKTTTDAADAADAFGFKVCGDVSKVGEADTGGGGGGGDSTDAATTDTGGTETPVTPVTPTTTTPVPVAPPTDEGGTPTPTPTPTPPPTDGGDDSSSGGVSP
jgi:cell division septation protein DedD